MTRDKYMPYGVAVVAGAAIAVWVGLPPALLLFLLVCPLMMFFMMRGMHGGQQGQHQTPTSSSDRGADVKSSDGSRERMDHPRPL